MPMQIHDVVLPPKLQKVRVWVMRKREALKGHVNLRGTKSNREKWYDRYPFGQQVKERQERIRMLISDDVNWRASLRLLVIYESTWIVYLFARMYIVVEDFASLRAMPTTAFDSVNWSLFIPHI